MKNGSIGSLNLTSDAQNTSILNNDSLQSSSMHQNYAIGAPSPPPRPPSNEEQMICMICEDKATGLHYGIITCEGYVKRSLSKKRH